MKLGISFSLARTNCQQNQLRHPKVFPGKTPIRQLLTLLWKMYSDKILSLKNLKGHWTIWGECFHTDNPSRILKHAVLKMFEFKTQTIWRLICCCWPTLWFRCASRRHLYLPVNIFFWIICFLNITGNVASFFLNLGCLCFCVVYIFQHW